MGDGVGQVGSFMINHDVFLVYPHFFKMYILALRSSFLPSFLHSYLHHRRLDLFDARRVFGFSWWVVVPVFGLEVVISSALFRVDVVRAPVDGTGDLGDEGRFEG